jgi:hypothetical protein
VGLSVIDREKPWTIKDMKMFEEFQQAAEKAQRKERLYNALLIVIGIILIFTLID